jgi:hypothetical protein
MSQCSVCEPQRCLHLWITPAPRDRDHDRAIAWIRRRAELEDGCCISVGGWIIDLQRQFPWLKETHETA